MKTIIKTIPTIFGFLLSCLTLLGNISLDIRLDLIKPATGALGTPETTLYMWVADTGGNGWNPALGAGIGSSFGNQVGSGASLDGAGDDVILWRSDNTLGGFDGFPGIFTDTLASGTADSFKPLASGSPGDWKEQDPIAFLWFPGLDINSMTIAGPDLSYGLFSAGTHTHATTSILSGGDEWLTPADSIGGHRLWSFGFDASSAAPNAGIDLRANMIVPEPSTYALIIGFAVLIPVVILRGRRMRKQAEEE